MTLKQALLQPGVDRTEIEIFLSALLQKDRSFIHAFPETVLTTSQTKTFKDFLDRRQNHEPLAYILGYQDFYGLRFKVTKAVLIPRPETESLVESAINHTRTLTRPDPVIVDVGTGSGCIAVALAKNLPNAKIIALEIDKEALEVAAENINKHQVSNQVEVIKSDLLSNFSQKADLIVANLPYVPTERIDTLTPEVLQEPRKALDGGSDGMVLYRKLFSQAKAKLKPNGVLICEVDDGEIIKKDFNSLQEGDPSERQALDKEFGLLAASSNDAKGRKRSPQKSKV